MHIILLYVCLQYISIFVHVTLKDTFTFDPQNGSFFFYLSLSSVHFVLKKAVFVHSLSSTGTPYYTDMDFKQCKLQKVGKLPKPKTFSLNGTSPTYLVLQLWHIQYLVQVNLSIIHFCEQSICH